VNVYPLIHAACVQKWAHSLNGFILLTVFTLVRFEVFTAVTMKNGVFWEVMPCGSCKSRRFGGT
jgi:hypothetical protein